MKKELNNLKDEFEFRRNKDQMEIKSMQLTLEGKQKICEQLEKTLLEKRKEFESEMESLKKKNQDLLSKKAVLMNPDELQKIKDGLKISKDLKNSLLGIVDRSKSSIDAVNSTLSCLSCLKFLDKPLMLVCGHSICQTVRIAN